MHTFSPVNPSTLKREERADALAALIILTQKRSGEIKGRACVLDGRTQRGKITKDEAASSTVSLEAILVTCAIEAHEN